MFFYFSITYVPFSVQCTNHYSKVKLMVVNLTSKCYDKAHGVHFCFALIKMLYCQFLFHMFDRGTAFTSKCSLRWSPNGRDSVSNHQPHHCLLNRLFRRRSKITLKLRSTGLCAGKSPGIGEFPAQMASYTEKVSIWWRHHVICCNLQEIKLIFSF